MRTQAALILLSALAGIMHTASATYGVDISSSVLIDHFKCMKREGFKFAIPRCYTLGNSPDHNCPHTIYNAWDGGMDHVDIYMFPCPRCGDPAGQVKRLLDYLAKYNIHRSHSPPATYGMVWIDVEGPQYWSTSKQANRNMFNGLVKELERQGQVVGVYTSESQWNPIMGDWHGGSHLPLWYPHYDNRASFSDFRSFGGWSRPNMKQYVGNAGVCSVNVDKNWY